uniref:Uncharacterized protein n=1 Tax=Anopheles coluzzii TaxID=1518534 RepID=A0A8W7PB94_ANOCL
LVQHILQPVRVGRGLRWQLSVLRFVILTAQHDREVVLAARVQLIVHLHVRTVQRDLVRIDSPLRPDTDAIKVERNNVPLEARSVGLVVKQRDHHRAEVALHELHLTLGRPRRTTVTLERTAIIRAGRGCISRLRRCRRFRWPYRVRQARSNVLRRKFQILADVVDHERGRAVAHPYRQLQIAVQRNVQKDVALALVDPYRMGPPDRTATDARKYQRQLRLVMLGKVVVQGRRRVVHCLPGAHCLEPGEIALHRFGHGRGRLVRLHRVRLGDVHVKVGAVFDRIGRARIVVD